jgi:hypothetical protein
MQTNVGRMLDSWSKVHTLMRNESEYKRDTTGYLEPVSKATLWHSIILRYDSSTQQLPLRSTSSSTQVSSSNGFEQTDKALAYTRTLQRISIVCKCLFQINDSIASIDQMVISSVWKSACQIDHTFGCGSRHVHQQYICSCSRKYV